MFHGLLFSPGTPAGRRLTPEFVEQYLGELAKTGYAYDIAHMRWSGHGDNAVPDPAICDFVRDWNARHAWPRFVISSTSEAFRAFEREYGARLPRVAGDWTPYWEDGAGSSALETALNRASSDRASQAEALWAMLAPEAYPMDAPRPFTGLISTFEKAGFRMVGQHVANRPIMGHDLRGIRARPGVSRE